VGTMGKQEGTLRVPERQCIACRRKRPRRELLRFVCSPDDQVLRDPSKSLPGRGAWLCDDAACLERACRRGLFRKAFRLTTASSPCLTRDLGL